jgi:hypothetical protein
MEVPIRKLLLRCDAGMGVNPDFMQSPGSLAFYLD